MKLVSPTDHTGTFYAHGKLMLSGEYLVMKGANALLIPLKKGQHMVVEAHAHEEETKIFWQASAEDKLWFTAVIDYTGWTIVQSTDEAVALKLVNILRTAGSINRHLFSSAVIYYVTTNAEFDITWGFGSSAALFVNIARWAKLDPHELYFRCASGSGADIAAAGSTGALLYRLTHGRPEIKPVYFKPAFHRNIFFAYLGHKQDTTVGVSGFMANAKIRPRQIENIDRITRKMLTAGSVDDFAQAIGEHEVIMAGILQTIRIKELTFTDFPGEVKSLGAWGGDFIMAVSEEPEVNIRSYFSNKNMHVLFSFEEIVW